MVSDFRWIDKICVWVLFKLQGFKKRCKNLDISYSELERQELTLHQTKYGTFSICKVGISSIQMYNHLIGLNVTNHLIG
jgi:hypothetical protein